MIKQTLNRFATQVFEGIPDYVLKGISLLDFKYLLYILHFVTFTNSFGAGKPCDAQGIPYS